jgi:hypothetical protein
MKQEIEKIIADYEAARKDNWQGVSFQDYSINSIVQSANIIDKLKVLIGKK